MEAKMNISAIAAMERLYGFIVTSDRGRSLIEEWGIARSGLDTLADYKQVVQRLASAGARLCDPINDDDKRTAAKEVMECVMKLQTIRTDR